MPIHDDLVRACADLGLELICYCERMQPRYHLILSGEECSPTLYLTVRDERDIDAHLLDVDLDGRRLLFEVSVKSVKREPNFDLWLEDVQQERWLVFRQDDAWQLQQVTDIEAIGELGTTDAV